MAGLLAVVFLLPPATTVVGATPEEIDRAIRRGVEFLYSRQNEHGNWERVQRNDGSGGASVTGGQWGGHTSIVVYTLLACGENPNDPRLARAIEFLRTAEIVGSYALGMRAQLWQFLPRTDENRAAALRDARQLLNMMSRSGRNRGFYDYLAGGNRLDTSASQYAVLGMWALAGIVEIPDNYWLEVERAWLAQQDPQQFNGWAYSGRGSANVPHNRVTPSMTAAGIATLFITNDMRYGTLGLDCKGNLTNPATEAINKAFPFMIAALPGLLGQQVEPQFLNNNAAARVFYTLYGVERIGVASGLKYFGEIDWFEAGARYIISRQRPDGGFNNAGYDIAGHCFGLLFLSRGREPVMFNKARWSNLPSRPNQPPVEASWNQRPRDVPMLAYWLGRQTERNLNWQILDLSVANVNDLFDAPILYIASSEPLRLDQPTKQKLKDYVELGGMLVFNPDCNSRPFIQSARALTAELFPNAELRPIPTSHPIFTQQLFPAEPNQRRSLMLGASNGARELVILFEEDHGRTWQSGDPRNPQHLRNAGNIYLYATDKVRGQYKGVRHIVMRDEKITPDRVVRLARLQYPGNWDPEPGGWRRLGAILNNDHRVELTTVNVDLNQADIPTDVQVAHLTGTGTIQLNADARARLKSFVDRGGLLLVDSAGGNFEFATAADTLLAEIFPDHAAELRRPLPPDHTLFTQPTPIPIDYRLHARSAAVGTSNAPRLTGIEIDRRLAVVNSNLDLSVGLVGQNVDGINGYAPRTATQIVTRLLLTRAQPRTPPAPEMPDTQAQNLPAGVGERPPVGQPVGVP